MELSMMFGKEFLTAMSGAFWIVFGMAAAYCWRIYALNEALGD